MVEAQSSDRTIYELPKFLDWNPTVNTELAIASGFVAKRFQATAIPNFSTEPIGQYDPETSKFI